MLMGTPLTATVASVVFGALALWYAGRGITGRDVPDQVSNLLHLLMATAMTAMPWVWAPPALPQVVAFSAGAFWYVGVALFRPGADADLGIGHGAHGARAHWYHAGMMLAMVWMAVAMIPGTPAASAMGMDMGHGHTGTAGGGMTGSAPWALAVSIALGFGFAVAAGWLVLLLIREAVGTARRHEVADLAASAVMAAGMSFALLVLMTRPA